jgi:hypothetical protein
MSGQIYQQIQKLIIECGQGDPSKISFIRAKLILKGIDPNRWGPDTDDSPEILSKINHISQTLIGV